MNGCENDFLGERIVCRKLGDNNCGWLNVLGVPGGDLDQARRFFELESDRDLSANKKEFEKRRPGCIGRQKVLKIITDVQKERQEEDKQSFA